MNDKDLLTKIMRLARRDDNGCLILKYRLNRLGYPHVGYNKKKIRANRLIMHLLKNFDLNSDKLVLHKPFICKSRSCIEIEHLYVGTHSDNVRDSVREGTNSRLTRNQWTGRTHCDRGHKLTKENIYKVWQAKLCRECARIRWRDANARRAEKKRKRKEIGNDSQSRKSSDGNQTII